MYCPSRKRSLRIETLLAFLDRLIALACLFGAEQNLYGQAPAASAPLTLQQVVDYTFAHNPASARFGGKTCCR